MKTQINPPAVSKINWAASLTALLNAAIGMSVANGWMTPAQAVPISTIASVALNALIVLFRSKFTDPN